MCTTCGCDSRDGISILLPGETKDHHQHGHDHDHPHDHDHNHPHTHSHEHSHGQDHVHETNSVTVDLERDVLYKNNLLAERNRGFFEARNVTALNLVSSPGSGKTMPMPMAA